MTRVRNLTTTAVVLGWAATLFGQPLPAPQLQPTPDPQASPQPAAGAMTKPAPDANLGRPRTIRPDGRKPAPVRPSFSLPDGPFPPPGTLGYTYRKRSYVLPPDRHPRDAMVLIEAPGASRVDIEGMRGFFGDDGLWHFEAERPLLPGIPHIYQAEAAYAQGDEIDVDVLVFRLIPGRIVTLQFPSRAK